MVASGHTQFTMSNNRIEDLLLDAVRDMFLENNVDNSDIDCVLVSTNDTKRYLGAILSELAGIRPRISNTIESMCSSGGSALVSAYSYIRSGLAKMVLVVGAEVMGSPGSILEWDISRGQFRSPVYWGSIMSKAYKRQYHVSPEKIAAVAAKNRTIAQDNRYAIDGNRYTIPDILQSRVITEDLRLLECSRTCAGSAAVLLTAEDMYRDITDTPVWIEGISSYTMRAGFSSSNNYYSLPAAHHAASEAYRMADVEPRDIDVAEVHDAFAVCEPMAIESLGITAAGKGAQMCYDLYGNGSHRINPRGGILGAGHALGATGVAQATEILLQLQNKAGSRQVDNPTIGLTHGMSAAGTTSVVMVVQS